MDVRNYWSIGGEASDYLDSCLELNYRTGNFSAGIVVIYDHWWEKDHDLFSAGPIAYYHLGNGISPFVRYQREWDRICGHSRENNKFRLGVELKF